MADASPTRVHHAVYVAPFGELADPQAIGEVAALTEAAGFDGLFLWDHMWRPKGRVEEVADVWIALAAASLRTSRIRVGPMVVPLARRRPPKLARESVSLDLLSKGRLTLGIGLGVDTGGELAKLGEVAEDRARADVLDEALEVLLALWSGEEVHHRGAHFVVDGVRFVPRSLQRPRIPLWGAARGGAGPRPLRRAARLDGLFPVQTSLGQLDTMLAFVREERGSLDGFDVALAAPDVDDEELGAHGVTWRIVAIPDGTAYDEVAAIVASGPRTSGSAASS